MSDDSGAAAPIDLAREGDFALGGLTVSPSSREIRRGELRESLEPRVMQVLVALHRAGGKVVSRDELIERCWEGRVVGDDAINRAIGRLRRLSETDGGASFEIETIPRVGYRLTTGAAAPAPKPAPLSHNRRWLLAGAGAAVLAAGGTGFYLLRRPAPVADMPPRLMQQLEQAKQAIRAGNPEAGAQAAGMYEHITTIDPGSADAWGGLALAYAFSARGFNDKVEAYRLRAEDAIRHARALNPHNAYAYAAAASLLPLRGAWARKEAIVREGLKFTPASDELLLQMADVLSNAGRNVEAADFATRANAAATQPDPALIWLSTVIYWSANRLAEADAIAAQGASLYPRQRSDWFTRVSLLMFTGRTDEALAILSNNDGRPPGTPDEDFDATIAVAHALTSKSNADIDAAMAANIALAHKGAGYAENAIAYAAALGRLDDAFLIANGLYFGRGFAVGNLRFSTMQRVYTQFQDRRTRTLFTPSSKAMRNDPRFAALVDEIGLTKYWKDAGVRPDYQRG
jgi:DNA-binding winged helix-turn-helix (wHTH) protein/tetratricopeptide (TPR) repeat protein